MLRSLVGSEMCIRDSITCYDFCVGTLRPWTVYVQMYTLCITCYDFWVDTLRPWTVYVRMSTQLLLYSLHPSPLLLYSSHLSPLLLYSFHISSLLLYSFHLFSDIDLVLGQFSECYIGIIFSGTNFVVFLKSRFSEKIFSSWPLACHKIILPVWMLRMLRT